LRAKKLPMVPKFVSGSGALVVILRGVTYPI
jgi:hypothetical protein